ncbi:MAG: nucleotidyl transferase AbiEii/AbiGii toxin family protein [Bacteroidales bacterium]|nr:nucleotidyl transferase AbiEii/AbiGii toxin family protein [Bacteroidales bacterium]
MLQYQTVDSSTLELLRKLQKIPDLSELRLVGGTSLALQLGHRKSIDLDLFGEINFEAYDIIPELNKIGKVTSIKRSKNINIFLIDGIKVDFVNYPYKWLEQPLIEDSLILATKKDIVAMKLAAVTGRGTKKDFIDLFFLLKEFSLSKMLDLYLEKYYDGSEFLVLKSLTYFADADNEPIPFMFEKIEWENVKEMIKQEVAKY